MPGTAEADSETVGGHAGKPCGSQVNGRLSGRRALLRQAEARSGSHHVFKMPWAGDPRINLQANGRDAKPYQVRQLLAAVDRIELLSKGTDDDG